MNKRSSAVEHTSRHQVVERIRRQLERRGYPRLQMLLLVALTGGAGFLASFGLLHAGLETLAWRYGLAVAIAYGFFLLLLWLWLRTNADDYDSVGEALLEVADALPSRSAEYKGGSGEFSGGGSTGRWQDSPRSSEPLVELPDMPEVGDLADADEVAIPLGILLLIVTIVITVLAASVSVVYSAPVLFAELLLDGVLAATLYRRLRRLDTRHWLQSALRRTIVPFAITALLMMAAGWALSIYAPAARSLGEALATF